MSDSTKPTIVMVPGAWLPPSTYQSFLGALEKVGYPTKCAELASMSPKRPELATVEVDATEIWLYTLLPLIEEEGKEIVIVMHSYGSMPASAAAKGYGVKELKLKGKKGGVLGLVFISAFLIPEGASLTDGTGGALVPWIEDNVPSAGLNVPDNPVDLFSADVEPSLAKKNADELLPHATLAFKSASPAPAWADPEFKGRLAYLVCTEDKAIPKAAQEGMMQHSGQDWHVRELQGSHNAPFLSKEKKAAEIIDGFVEKFLQAVSGSS